MFRSFGDSERNSHSLNATVKVLVLNDRNEEALALHRRFEALQTETTHIFAVRACTNLDDEERGRAIHRRCAERVHSVELKTDLVAFYGHFGDIAAAEALFDSNGDGKKTTGSATECIRCGEFRPGLQCNDQCLWSQRRGVAQSAAL